MSKIGPIVLIGFGLFVGGLYYHLWNDATEFLSDYILNDSYYQLINFVWDAIPVAMVIIGIIWLIKQGAGSRGTVMYE